MEKKTINITTNKTSVNEFCKKYSTVTNDEIKNKMIDGIITRKYAPFIAKKTVLKLGIEKSMVEVDGVRYVDEVNAYLNFVMSVLVLYTNFDLKTDENSNIVDYYDILKENGVIDKICASIGDGELKELGMINDMIKKSIIDIELSTPFYVANQVTRFATIAGVSLNTILEKLNTTLEGLDESKINKFVSKIEKMIQK